MDELRRAGVPRLIAAVLLCEAAGGAGALATGDGLTTWYRTLKKPPFNPPDWIFGPAWTTLYALMGLALAVISVDGRDSGQVRAAQTVFGLQLVLNAAWTFIFFGRRMPLAALIELMFLWLTILVTIALFMRISRLAGLLLVLYLLWVTFAGVLNAAIWHLNK